MDIMFVSVFAQRASARAYSCHRRAVGEELWAAPYRRLGSRKKTLAFEEVLVRREAGCG